MEKLRVKGVEVRPGDDMHLWMGVMRVEAVEPYTGPFGFVVGVARFTDGTGMSLEDHRYYKVTRVTAERSEGDGFR